MTGDQTRSLWGHITVYLILAGTFYALVIYPYELSELVKGAFIGFSGTAIAWEFGTAVANATAKQQQNATAEGAAAGAMVPSSTTTVSAGPPVTVTTTPSTPAEEDIA